MRLPSSQGFSSFMRQSRSELGSQAHRDQRMILVETAQGTRLAVEVMRGDIEFVRFPAHVAELGAEVDIAYVEAAGETQPGLPASLAEVRLDLAVGAIVFLQLEDAAVGLQRVRDQLQVDAGIRPAGKEFQCADPVERMRGVHPVVGRVTGTSPV